MSDPTPPAWKVFILRDSGQFHHSGPFTTHEFAEQCAIAHASCPAVMAVLIGLWEEDHKPVDWTSFAEALKASGKG